MRVLVNASACVIGGGIQVAAGLVNHIATQQPDKLGDWHFALSREVTHECDPAFLGQLDRDGRLLITDCSPGSILRGRRTRVKLKELCRSSGCQRVFSVFGPSYVRFPVPEYMGFADAFAYASTQESYTWHPLADRIIGRFKKWLKMHFVAVAHRYWVEAPFAQTALAKALDIPECRVSVIPNCVNSRIVAALLPHMEPKSPRFLFLAAAYWHKNHMILPEVLRKVRKQRPDIQLNVVTTLPVNSPQWVKLSVALDRAGVSDMVDNKGQLPIADVALELSRCTAVLQLSLLETFSSTYVEAMASGLPLLVSDRAFAHDVCGDAALYVNPLDSTAIALHLLMLADNRALREKLVSRGKSQLARFPDSDTKNGLLINFCTQ